MAAAMGLTASFEGKRLFITFDPPTLHWLNGQTQAQSLERVIRTCVENWRTLGGLPHSLYQRLIAQAAAQRTPLPLFVSELLTRATLKLPPVPAARLATIETPIDDVDYDRQPPKSQVGVRFDAQQLGHLQRVAHAEHILPTNVAQAWAGCWRSLGGAVTRPTYQHLLHTAELRHIPLSALVADLLATQVAALPASATDASIPTPIDTLSPQQLAELEQQQLRRPAKPLPPLPSLKKKRRSARP